MNRRENYLSIIKRTGYEKVPVDFSMCPSLMEKFKDYIKANNYPYDFHHERKNIPHLVPAPVDPQIYVEYYDFELKPGAHIDSFGIAHEPGSEQAKHMTRMRHPLFNIDSVDQLYEYPFPDFSNSSLEAQKSAVLEAVKNDQVSIGGMQTTIWETAWYLRGMENLMDDMMSDSPLAEAILNKVTDIAVIRATAYAQAGCDAIFLGDDVGMQSTLMMSPTLYIEWLKPRLKKVIDAAKTIKPDLLVFYHSCGYITPLIPHLIDVGIDVLNPVQPECMDFKEIFEQFGDKLSFHGTIGTQRTMPFGKPLDVRREVYKNLDIAGEKGGLLVAPTHLLEPEVPVENVIAYIEACRNYK